MTWCLLYFLCSWTLSSTGPPRPPWLPRFLGAMFSVGAANVLTLCIGRPVAARNISWQTISLSLNRNLFYICFDEFLSGTVCIMSFYWRTDGFYIFFGKFFTFLSSCSTCFLVAWRFKFLWFHFNYFVFSINPFVGFIFFPLLFQFTVYIPEGFLLFLFICRCVLVCMLILRLL